VLYIYQSRSQRDKQNQHEHANREIDDDPKGRREMHDLEDSGRNVRSGMEKQRRQEAASGLNEYDRVEN